MSSSSITYWIIVLIIVVSVFGTRKLRNAGKNLGGVIHDFKKGLNEGIEDQSMKRDEVIERKKDEEGKV